MHRYGVFPTSVALVLALFMAPFQHVHLSTHEGHEAEERDPHHDSALIHTHGDLVNVPENETGAPHAGSSPEEHHGISLNTFATAITSPPNLVFHPVQFILPIVIAEQFTRVEIVEERGHDPPQLDFSTPRAPPA